MNARAVILALFFSLGVSGCVSADPDLRAKWYLYNPEPPDSAEDFEPDIYVELINVGKKSRSVSAVYMNGPPRNKATGLIPAGWRIEPPAEASAERRSMTLRPGQTLLIPTKLMEPATERGKKPRLLCEIPVRLYIEGGDDPSAVNKKLSEVPLINALPSALAPERRYLPCVHRDGPKP